MFVVRDRRRGSRPDVPYHCSFAEESFAELRSKTGGWTGISIYGVAWESFSVRDCILSIRGELGEEQKETD